MSNAGSSARARSCSGESGSRSPVSWRRSTTWPAVDRAGCTSRSGKRRATRGRCRTRTRSSSAIASCTATAGSTGTGSCGTSARDRLCCSDRSSSGSSCSIPCLSWAMTARTTRLARPGRVRCEDWVQTVVFGLLRRSSEPPEASLRLYRGRRFDDDPAEPFSFVPSLPCVAGASAFPRPPIHLDRHWIEPNLAMGAKPTPASRAELSALWDQIVHQVVDVAGLALGVHLDAPSPAP